MTDCILTYTGIEFSPICAEPHHISPRDIAHALSLMTRANGHFPTFFSVAQHSLNCAKEAAARSHSERVQLYCLLHDAQEAYISDLTRPVKAHLTKYVVIEKQLQSVIFKAFGLGKWEEEEACLTGAVDDAMLYHDFFHFTGHKTFPEEPRLFSSPDLSERPFSDVEQEFLELFNALQKETVKTAPLVL